MPEIYCLIIGYPPPLSPCIIFRIIELAYVLACKIRRTKDLEVII